MTKLKFKKKYENLLIEFSMCSASFFFLKSLVRFAPMEDKDFNECSVYYCMLYEFH